MPRYFFRCDDSGLASDHEGVDLPNLSEARLEAVRFAASTVLYHPTEMWDGKTLRVEVSDDVGVNLCTVVMSGLAASAERGLRHPERAAE